METGACELLWHWPFSQDVNSITQGLPGSLSVRPEPCPLLNFSSGWFNVSYKSFLAARPNAASEEPPCSQAHTLPLPQRGPLRFGKLEELVWDNGGPCLLPKSLLMINRFLADAWFTQNMGMQKRYLRFICINLFAIWNHLSSNMGHIKIK